MHGKRNQNIDFVACSAIRKMPKRPPFLRSLLLQRFNWIEERGLQMARLHGYSKVTPAMSRLLGNMTGRPLGLSELARRMGISRQSVHKLANEVAKLGLVELVASPDDMRVVLLQFTKAGWAMSAQAAKDFEELEADLRQYLGARDLDELKRLLSVPWDINEKAAAATRDQDP